MPAANTSVAAGRDQSSSGAPNQASGSACLNCRERMGSTVLDAVGLVAAAALLADHGERRLQRIEVLDRALGLGDGLAEARGMLVEPGLVAPDLGRDAVVAARLGALEALRKQRRQLLGGVVELGQSGVHGGLVVGLLAL